MGSGGEGSNLHMIVGRSQVESWQQFVHVCQSSRSQAQFKLCFTFFILGFLFKSELLRSGFHTVAFRCTRAYVAVLAGVSVRGQLDRHYRMY
jgi:hypothetical protein